jgi:AcrR family transcriptional regulator
MTAARTTPEGDAQRERILRAATELFAARGFRGASLEAVAQAVGITRQGVLHHFPSKVHLLLGVLALRDRDDAERLTGQFSNVVDGLLGAVRHNQGAPDLVRLYTVLSAESVDPEHPGHEHFRERYRTLRAVLGEAVAEAQAAGELSDRIAPERLALLLGAVMDGLQLQFLLEPDAVDMVEPLADLLAALGPTMLQRTPGP